MKSVSMQASPSSFLASVATPHNLAGILEEENEVNSDGEQLRNVVADIKKVKKRSKREILNADTKVHHQQSPAAPIRQNVEADSAHENKKKTGNRDKRSRSTTAEKEEEVKSFEEPSAPVIKNNAVPTSQKQWIYDTMSSVDTQQGSRYQQLLSRRRQSRKESEQSVETTAPHLTTKKVRAKKVLTKLNNAIRTIALLAVSSGSGSDNNDMDSVSEGSEMSSISVDSASETAAIPLSGRRTITVHSTLTAEADTIHALLERTRSMSRSPSLSLCSVSDDPSDGKLNSSRGHAIHSEEEDMRSCSELSGSEIDSRESESGGGLSDSSQSSSSSEGDFNF
jgi:hypothetical protein